MREDLSYRPLEPGMGEAVAARTILRPVGGRRETWGEVADRVALGNVMLQKWRDDVETTTEYTRLRDHIAFGRVLMSGRHLQHGDFSQPRRNMEVFTNCLEKSTKILTLEFGPVEIGSIVGERVHVLASDGEWRPADVKAYGKQTLYQIEFGTLNGGKLRHTVKATANHRWLLRDGTVTDALKVGDVLQPARSNVKRDPEAVVHGLIYGDGTVHKSRSDSHPVGVLYGRTYASIRVCKQDAVKDEIHRILDEAGFRYTTPPHAKGDRVYYLGRYPYGKELPCTTDPDYIEGFIYGWWLADGHKMYDYSDAVVISTANEDAVRWLEDYAAYAGYSIVSLHKHERKKGDGSYPNGRTLYTIRLRKGVEWKVRDIKPAETDTVYCVEEPVTQSFTLANGLLTGNCSTAAASFIKFYLLLNGSGVGRLYDDALMVVDWDFMPDLVCALDADHPDYEDRFPTPDEAIRRLRKEGRTIKYYLVPDSREGWAKAVEILERMAFERTHKDSVLLLDFSKVRPKGSPIGGMQNRPASGPIPLMDALLACHAVKGQGMEPWEQAMRIDHELAACVAVGGARRAARIAIKNWRDPGIFKFIDIKEQGGLWSANNSIAVDAEFWSAVESAYAKLASDEFAVRLTDDEMQALRVFEAATKAQYEHGTGEPGFINIDRLNTNEEGLERYADGKFTHGFKYRVDPMTEQVLLKKVYEGLLRSRYKFIVNPCVTADTWVQTSEGPQQVSDLIGKPFTAVVDGKEYAATGFWQTGVKEVLRVRTDRGYELRLTANHKLLVERNKRQKFGGGYNRDLVWVEAGDLKPGDRLVLHNHRGYEWDGEGTEEEGWLLGEIVGDGGCNPEKYPTYLRFWGPSREVMKDEAVAAVRGLPYSVRSDFRGTESGGVVSVYARALDALALRYITEGEKRLLPAIEKTSAAFHRGFLRGLFDADGSVQGSVSHGRSVRLTQSGAVGLERLQVVQRMLLRLGIASTIYENRKEAGTSLLPDGKGGVAEYDTEAVHELVISRDNIHQFAREVGFTEPSKQEALQALVSELTRGPYAESFTAEVVEVVPDGAEPVYDCTVAEVHRFDANGIMAHNCGEIVLLATGGYCVIADVVPFFADDLDQARDAFLAATRALIRTNRMQSLYQKEVERTNRIGVGMTGIQEFAWKFFGLTFRDLIADFDRLINIPDHCDVCGLAECSYCRPFGEDEEPKAWKFWRWLRETRKAVEAEADRYSDELGVTRPHTVTTIKPAGCRPWNALTTTTHGLLTLQELFEDHEDGAVWSDIKRPIAAIQDGQTRRLVRTFDNGEAEVLRVRLSYGLTVESTANHPWYVKRRYLGNARYQEVGEWVPAGELKPGDVLDVNVGVYQNTNHAPLRRVPMFAVRMRGNGNSIRQPETMNPDLAWLLGYLWGDGAMSPEKYRLRWLDRNVENLRKANRILREQFGISGTLRKDPNKDAHSLEVGNKELWHWLIKNGFYKYYEDEIDLIPRAVRASARDDIIAFIAGLVDADGAIGRTKSDYTVTLAQQHERFSRHVQDVGWAVGLAFGMSHNTVGENWQPARKSMYLLTLSAASAPDAVRVLARHSTKMSAAEKESGFVRWRANHPGRAIRRVIGKVESVESVGVMPTYDVEVEDNHWFYAGAVKSHNTTSKLFLLTEGAHLPARTEFLRWVQFQKGDPLIAEYEAKGYPTQEVEQYPDVVMVGFPTQPMICRLGIPRERLVTASEATMEEQYKWVQLLEKFWLGPRGNQVSYTLKYDREAVSLSEYRDIIRKNQPHVRAISVMPASDWRKTKEVYGYVPEEPISLEEFQAIEARIAERAEETISLEDLRCEAGACPL